MKRQLKGILYYLMTDARYSFFVFWAILGSLLLLTVILELSIGAEHTVVSFNLSFPIYIYAGIAGYLMVKNVLPYLIRLGATRKHLFVGMVIFFTGLSFINAFIANLLHSATSAIIDPDNVAGVIISDGDATYNLHHLADVLANDGWISRIVIDTSVSFFFLSVLFIIGLIFYRYGLIGGFSFIGVLIFSIIFGLTNGWLIDFFASIFSDFSILFFYQLFLVGIVIYLFSFLFLRRITI